MTNECEDVRLQLMAAADGEANDEFRPVAVEAHLQGCTDCRGWVAGLSLLDANLKRLGYLHDPVNLWPKVESRILSTEAVPELPIVQLSLLVVFALAWRTAQLLTDFPSQIVDVALAIGTVGVALRLMPLSLFDIQTSAPELQKRGA